MYAQLGDIIFQGALGPEAQELSGSALYAEHALIDGKPRLQRTGTSLDELKLTIHLHASFCTPEDEIRKLHVHRLAGTTLPYITGAGRLVGDFVITTIKESPVQLSPTGRIIEANVDVSLIESHDPDKEATDSQAAINSGFAQQKNSPPVSVETITPITPTLLASKSVSSIIASNGGVSDNLKAAKINPAQEAAALKEVVAKAKAMKKSTQDAITKVNVTTGDIYNDTRQLEAALQSSIAFVTDLQTAAESSVLLDSLDAFDALQPLVSNIRKEGEILAVYNSSRIAI